MPDVKGLIRDPRFRILTPEQQKAAIAQVEPKIGQLSDEQFNTFVNTIAPQQQDTAHPPPASDPGFFTTLGRGVANIPTATMDWLTGGTNPAASSPTGVYTKEAKPRVSGVLDPVLYPQLHPDFPAWTMARHGKEMGDQAKAALAAGDPSTATGLALASFLPGRGDLAVQAGTDFGEGRYGSGFANSLLALTPGFVELAKDPTVRTYLGEGGRGFKEGFTRSLKTAKPSPTGKFLGKLAGAGAGHMIAPGLEGPAVGGYFGGDIGEHAFNIPEAVKAGVNRAGLRIRMANAPPRVPVWERGQLPTPPGAPEAPVQGAQPPFPSGRIPGHLEGRPVAPQPPPRVPVWEQGQQPTPQAAPEQPVYGAQPPFPSGRIPGHLREGMPPAPELPPPPGRVPIWEQGQEPTPPSQPEAAAPGAQPPFPSGRIPGHLKGPTLGEQMDGVRAKMASGEPLTDEDVDIVKRYGASPLAPTLTPPPAAATTTAPEATAPVIPTGDTATTEPVTEATTTTEPTAATGAETGTITAPEGVVLGDEDYYNSLPDDESRKLYNNNRVHAIGREMDLTGSPAGKNPKMTPVAKELYGKGWMELTPSQMRQVTKFMVKHKRLPGAADVESGLYKHPVEPVPPPEANPMENPP